MDGTKFLDMLSKISLEEILQLEFRNNPTSKWETLVTPSYPLRKYNCNICRVVQFGDKNLFSHLSGKKHIAVMKLKEQLQIRNKPSVAPPTKKGPNTNANNNKNSQSPAVKNLGICDYIYRNYTVLAFQDDYFFRQYNYMTTCAKIMTQQKRTMP